MTDKSYITNSYHIHVTEKINAFDKLAFESQFQALSPGGAISWYFSEELPALITRIFMVVSTPVKTLFSFLQFRDRINTYGFIL